MPEDILRDDWFWMGYDHARAKKPDMGYIWANPVFIFGRHYRYGYLLGLYDESCLNDMTNVY